MVGIVSYGAYVPPTRLAFGEKGPERSVAWFDEDAVTMGVAAAVECLRGFDRASVDGVCFASTTQPFREKQAATLLAKALDLRREVATADHAGSLRAGTGALRAALDAVAAGSARRVLVVASDCRPAAPGSGLERSFGDGAAAFLVGDADVVAGFEASFSVADEIVDLWRAERDRFVHSWEERFVVQEGYLPRVVEAVQGLAHRTGRDFDRVALTGPDARSLESAARELRVERERIVDPLFGRLGHAGVAFTPLLLASALEAAKPGERLLVASHGDGAEALAFSVTGHVEKLEPRRALAWHLERRRPVRRYEQYLRARNLDAREWEAASDPGLSATVHHRERDEDVSFQGQRCRRCGALQFPMQRVCESCFAKDDFERVRLSDRTGTVVTWTFDHFFPAPDPPTIVTVVDVEGARVHLQLVNARPEDMRSGLPVEFTFRRVHEVGGRPNYYWKGVPV